MIITRSVSEGFLCLAYASGYDPLAMHPSGGCQTNVLPYRYSEDLVVRRANVVRAPNRSQSSSRQGDRSCQSRSCREFLDSQHVKYITITHSPAYTAQEIAACAHIPGKDLAKTVMVKIDGKMAMAVVPASHKVNLDRCAASVGAKKLRLASEQDFKDRFPDCEIGAMPPFGNLYDMDVYVSETLAEDSEIAFNAGSHTELVQAVLQGFRAAGPSQGGGHFDAGSGGGLRVHAGGINRNPKR